MPSVDARFEWDEDKRLGNIAKHDIDFGDAVEIFDGRHSTMIKANFEAEDRFITIGKLDHRTIAVVWTQRGSARRIISARRARKKEKVLLEEKLNDETLNA